MRKYGSSLQLREPLYPDVGRVRDIAQLGDFRGNRRHAGEVEVRSGVTQPLMTGPLDPRVKLIRPRLHSISDDVLSLPSSGSSDVATILVILKSTVGGTLVVIPGGFLGAGFIPASVCLIFVGCIEIFCMVLLIRCRQLLGEDGSYGEIARQATGRIGCIAVETSLLLSQLGFTCAEMLYVAKNTHGVIGSVQSDILDNPLLSVTGLLLLQLVITVPMTWFRKLKYFQVSNFIANATILLALSIILGVAANGLAEHGAGEGVQMVGSKWLMFAGTAVFSFECINFVIPMYDAHEKKESFVPILCYTLGGVVMLFVCFGSLCYVRYGRYTEPVVTLNLPSGSPMGKIVPLAFAFASLLNVPLFLFPATALIEEKLFNLGPPDLRRTWAKNGVRTLLTLVCAGVAILCADSIEAMVAIIGSLCCVPLAFIYPVFFYIRLFNPCFLSSALFTMIGALGVALFILTTMSAMQEF
mmetsp:Transcript_84175/g.132934  ORF Transcript_84175/g.132934 Transcript_84175/m.132934 type:complete len:470 (+) Transcript_84175:126-1535(+)